MDTVASHSHLNHIAVVPGKKTFLLPTDFAALGYLLAASILIVIFNPQLPGWWRYLLLHLGIASSILFLATIQWNHPIFRFIRHWYPFFLVMFLFWEAENFVHLVFPEWKNGWLLAADFKILGGHPTVALERITNPFWTEFFEFVYFSYYFIPFFGLWLYLKKSEPVFQSFTAHYFLALYFGYLLFPFFPAEGPWKTLAGNQTMLIEGKWIFRQINDYLHHKGAIVGGCFPSTHLSAATAAVFAAARLNKKLFWGSVIWFALLFFSTVYGRYHYFVDGLAGILVGSGAFLVARRMVAWRYGAAETVPGGTP